MPDWTKSMTQFFEYYEVDPYSWTNIRRINNVKSSKIVIDSGAETFGSATYDISEDIGECYIRTYLVIIQNGKKEKIPLGTHIVQTPSHSFDGKEKNISIDAYTPLLELKEKYPPIGFTVTKNTNIMDSVYNHATNNMRGPTTIVSDDHKLYKDFTASSNETWLTFLISLAKNADYKIGLDEIGKVLFYKDVNLSSASTVWTYNDDNSSILYPDISIDRDLYGIPNVVEVLHTSNNGTFYAIVKNENPDSPTSINNRGREIVYRDCSPNILGNASQGRIQEYAENLLENLSSLEYTVTYSHGYYPVKVGDCVLLNYERAGLRNIKAKVINQSIECSTGCKVTETAVYTKKLWEA